MEETNFIFSILVGPSFQQKIQAVSMATHCCQVSRSGTPLHDRDSNNSSKQDNKIDVFDM